jgi:hypothetical protein
MADIIDFESDPVADTQQTLRSAANGCFNVMRSGYVNADTVVWNNPYGLTPAEVFAAMGTKGGSLVSFLTQVKNTVNAVAPASHDVESSKPAEVNVTINGDGTVTLS